MSATPTTQDADPPRCDWCLTDDLSRAYHDTEWGVPSRDDRALFEHLVLEVFQAGLSWRTILNKREAFRRAFDGFDPERIAAYGDAKVTELLADAGIIRNARKIRAAIENARAFLSLQEQEGSFARYCWEFVGGQPLVNEWATQAEVPATTELSERFSRDLKRRGFVFEGPTTTYAHMQATGMVNDHLLGCFRRAELLRAGGEPSA